MLFSCDCKFNYPQQKKTMPSANIRKHIDNKGMALSVKLLKSRLSLKSLTKRINSNYESGSPCLSPIYIYQRMQKMPKNYILYINKYDYKYI